jgi:hypothetical protein
LGWVVDRLGDPVAYRAAVDAFLGLVKSDPDGWSVLVQTRAICDQILAHYGGLFSLPQVSVMIYRAMVEQGVEEQMALAVTFEMFEGV